MIRSVESLLYVIYFKLCNIWVIRNIIGCSVLVYEVNLMILLIIFVLIVLIIFLFFYSLKEFVNVMGYFDIIVISRIVIFLVNYFFE